jgi:hypothetical protein
MSTGLVYNTDRFIHDASSIHNNVYDYSLCEYTGHMKDVSIVCKIHGQFKQNAYRHLKGKGCKKCGHLKRIEKWKIEHIVSEDEFIKEHYTKYGAQVCADILNKAAHTIHLRAQQLRIRKNSPKLNHIHVPARLWSNIINNAKLRGLEVNITPDDIYQQYLKQDKKCALSGKAMVLCTDVRLSTVSVDRIDSKVGYCLGNIQLVLKQYNQAKMDLTDKEFYNLCKSVYFNLKGKFE